jgi:hypothetical protein
MRDPWGKPTGPQHWHITRARKPAGECVACDLEREEEAKDGAAHHAGRAGKS